MAKGGHNRINFHHTEKTKKLISEKLKGRKMPFGFNIGRKAWNKGLTKEIDIRLLNQSLSLKNSYKEGKVNHHPWLKGKKRALTTINKIRKATQKRILLLNGPRLGTNETKILNRLESCLGLKILRQYSIKGYFIDGYIPELKIAIEIDEDWHRKNKPKDIKRQNFIEKELNCCFLRIKDYE